MLIIGHSQINCEEFLHITSPQEVQQSNAVLWFEDSLKDGFIIAKKCLNANISFGMCISNITNFLLYASFTPKYFFITHDTKTYQQIADHYLLDSKILQIISDEGEIQKVAMDGIDGVIFKHILLDNE